MPTRRLQAIVVVLPCLFHLVSVASQSQPTSHADAPVVLLLRSDHVAANIAITSTLCKTQLASRTKALRLRGGKAPYVKGRPGKDPMMLDPAHVFDALSDGAYSKLVEDDDSELVDKTEDDLQLFDPNDEEVEGRKRRKWNQAPDAEQGNRSLAAEAGSHQPDEDAESDTTLEVAVRACLDGDLEAATTAFEQCLEEDARDVAAMNNYATMLYGHELNVGKAETLLRSALDIAPNCTEAMCNLALLLLDQEKQEEAEQLFRRILTVEPQHVATLNNYALFLQNVKRNYTGAESLLLQAEAADPFSVGTLGNYIHLLHHHFPDRQYVESRPDVAGPHYNMTGMELARALTLRAMRIDGSHPWVQKNAPEYLSQDSEAYRRYRARFPGYRPSNFHMEPGVGVIRSPSRSTLDAAAGAEATVR